MFAINLILAGSTDRQLEEMLRNLGMRANPVPGSELATLAQPAARQPEVIVVDLRDQTHIPSALPLLKRQHPATGIVIVASKLDPAMMPEAMRAGVNECVTDPVTQADMEAAIARVLAQRPAPAPTGQVFAFLGAKGGVGTTTVAINVATALTQIEPASTLLIDLHLTNGDAAVFLGAEPRFSVVEALENTHRLDEAFFRSLIVRAKSGPDLLASSDRAMVSPVDVRRIRMLLEFAARHYRFIILDVPRSDSSMLDALESVNKIVVVTNQELASVRSASRMATALRQRYGKDRMTVVLSRSDRLAEIGHEDIERAVGGSVKHTFPSDYRLALQALNKGRPLTLENHSELANSLKQFARSIAGITAPPPERGPRIFGRLTGRRS